MVIIQNQTKNSSLTTQGALADTFFTRLKGLLGSPPLKAGEGLLLKGEKSIHTFFMSFPIDVIYINSASQVIKLDEDMPPYRIGNYITQAAYILEVPVGTIKHSQTTVGDQLTISINP